MLEQNKDSPQVAIAWMVLAGLCFSATGVFVKLTGGLLVVWTVIFGRSIVISGMTFFILASIRRISPMSPPEGGGKSSPTEYPLG